MTFSLFFQSLINGLNLGATYALIALGYTMVYGIIRMINFAHGDFIMIGAYTLFYTVPLMVDSGMPAWLAVAAAIVVCAIVGVLVETFAYRPVRKAGPMSALITALAMSIFLQNLAMVLFGSRPHNVSAIFSLPSVSVAGVTVSLNVVLTIVIGLAIMLGLQLFVQKTKLGKAMRAVPQDRDASTLMGINVNRIITVTFAIGSALAAVAALMYCTTYPRRHAGRRAGGPDRGVCPPVCPRLVRGGHLRHADRHPAGQALRHPGPQHRRESVREA